MSKRSKAKRQQGHQEKFSSSYNSMRRQKYALMAANNLPGSKEQVRNRKFSKEELPNEILVTGYTPLEDSCFRLEEKYTSIDGSYSCSIIPIKGNTFIENVSRSGHTGTGEYTDVIQVKGRHKPLVGLDHALKIGGNNFLVSQEIEQIEYILNKFVDRVKENVRNAHPREESSTSNLGINWIGRF
ncbi:MAG: hypothetical protein WC438_04130 [Candidatus Pacearchaeota archaeon]